MRLLILSLSLMLTACGGGTVKEDMPASGPELLPQEIQQMTERLRVCAHLSGEFGGDGAERDREITAEMDRLRCNSVAAEADALRQKYAGQPLALQSLDEAVAAQTPVSVAEAASPDEADGLQTDISGLPSDADELIKRWEHCLHFAGEFGGDGSERDREVSAEMDKLGCGNLEADTAGLRQKYRNRPEVLKAFEGVEDSGN